jgi:hypothetical protein
MNRRFAVFGLAVAMSGSVVAGQTPQTAAPVAIPASGAQSSPLVDTIQITPLTRRTLREALAAERQAQQGQTTFRVESVGSRTRIYVTTDGAESWTLEAIGFTVTTQASGTTITASGPVTMTTTGGKTISLQGLTLQLGPGDRVSGSTFAPIGNK